MTDSDADDGIELEAQWELAPPTDATDETKLNRKTEGKLLDA